MEIQNNLNSQKCFAEENLTEFLKLFNNDKLHVDVRAKNLIISLGNQFIDTVLDKSLEF